MAKPELVDVRHDGPGRVRVRLPGGADYIWPHQGATLAVRPEHVKEIVEKYGKVFGLVVAARTAGPQAVPGSGRSGRGLPRSETRPVPPPPPLPFPPPSPAQERVVEEVPSPPSTVHAQEASIASEATVIRGTPEAPPIEESASEESEPRSLPRRRVVR